EMVAVKLIAPRAAASERVNQKFLTEIQRLGQLKHPRNVGFREAGRSDGHFYLVTDYVDTVNLREVLARVPPRKAAKAAVGVVCQTLEFLHQVHERSWVHLDIK